MSLSSTETESADNESIGNQSTETESSDKESTYNYEGIDSILRAANHVEHHTSISDMSYFEKTDILTATIKQLNYNELKMYLEKYNLKSCMERSYMGGALYNYFDQQLVDIKNNNDYVCSGKKVSCHHYCHYDIHTR